MVIFQRSSQRIDICVAKCVFNVEFDSQKADLPARTIDGSIQVGVVHGEILIVAKSGYYSGIARSLFF